MHPSADSSREAIDNARMDLLILGGTRFLGLHTITQALNAGHRVTTFTRGKSPVVLPAQVTQLTGDRDGGLDALRIGQWDSVIDTSGYVPRIVRQSAELLHGRVGSYQFISSISVYAGLPEPHMDEDAPLEVLSEPDSEEIAKHYGALKVECERVVQEKYGAQALIIRPGLIVGEHDPTDRFSYWPWRVAQGGEVLAPGGPETPTQFIDAKDLAAWMLSMAEKCASGVFNATSPADRYTLGDVLDACLHVSRSAANFRWVSEEFLAAQKVESWSDMPMWLPASLAKHKGFMRASCARAEAAGLTCRPLAATVRDVLAMLASRPAGTPLKAGITREREAALLAQLES